MRTSRTSRSDNPMALLKRQRDKMLSCPPWCQTPGTLTTDSCSPPFASDIFMPTRPRSEMRHRRNRCSHVTSLQQIHTTVLPLILAICETTNNTRTSASVMLLESTHRCHQSNDSIGTSGCAFRSKPSLPSGLMILGLPIRQTS